MQPVFQLLVNWRISALFLILSTNCIPVSYSYSGTLKLIADILDVIHGKTLSEFFKETDLGTFTCRGQKLQNVQLLQRAGKACKKAERGEICKVLCVLQQLKILNVTSVDIEYDKPASCALVGKTAPVDLQDDINKAFKKCACKLMPLDNRHGCEHNRAYVDCLRVTLSQICDIARLLVDPDDDIATTSFFAENSDLNFKEL